MEILNNFIGYVSSITIDHEVIKFSESNDPIKEKYIVAISKNSKNHIKYQVLVNDYKLDPFEEYNFKKNEETFSKEFIHLNYNKKNNKYMIKKKKYLNQLKYYGGFESFIPIFKILKYIISDLETIISNKNEKEKLDHYINESIEWIKDILKIMLKMICLSEKNYQNFKKIIIPLLGAFSEIYHCLKKLDSKNYTSNLFNDEVFFILYIIILNQNIPNNIKDAFNFIFEINENFNNFNFTMKPLIFNLKENKVNLDWYYFIIFYFIEFFLLYYGSKEKVPSKFTKQINLIL